MRSDKLIRLSCAPIKIAEGLAILVTLGYFSPLWEMNFLVWNMEQERDRQRKFDLTSIEEVSE